MLWRLCVFYLPVVNMTVVILFLSPAERKVAAQQTSRPELGAEKKSKLERMEIRKKREKKINT